MRTRGRGIAVRKVRRLVSHLVLTETTCTLGCLRTGRCQARRRHRDDLNHRELSVQDPDVVMKALEHFRKKPSRGFSDCLILEVARRAGHLPLGTFDRDLAKLDGAERL